MNSNGLSVCLLAAGYGTRLYPLTKDCPKALLPLGSGGVILDWILNSIETVPGKFRILLVTNHKFFPQFGAWKRQRGNSPACAASDVAGRLELVDDGTSTPHTRLGAVRDLLLARAHADQPSDLLVLGTDNLFTWSLADFVTFAKSKRPAATVALRQADSLHEASRCAVVELDRQARLVRCIEKPASPLSSTVALCVYYFPSACQGRIDEFVREGGNVDAPGYFIEWLVKQEPVYGFMTGGEWFDIGSQDAYQEAVQRRHLLPSLRPQRTHPTGG